MDSEARRKLDRVFKPRSVAVVGASRRKGSLGWQVMHNLILFEFNGKIFPVNPQAEVIHSFKCYPSVTAIDDEVDLAVLIVPAAHAAEVVDECGRKGVGGVVVISAGFKEIGGAGIEREKELKEVVRRHGMRMVGPNCMGILNATPGVRLDAVFAETLPVPGNVAFSSQSGAMGAAIINQAADMGLGFSMFASMGNKADISGNDLLEYWEDDPDTHVILLYLESFGNPRNFTRLARRITRKKPIIAVKSGRTGAGARAASSHTGALGGADVAVDALFEQCGVLRVRSVEELFDVALAFSTQPVPKGRRVGIITNAGGPGIMAVDALVSHGLELPELPERVKQKLRAELPDTATLSNPLDLVGSATAPQYRLALEAMAAEEVFDSILLICVPTVVHDPTDIYLAAAEVVSGAGKTCLGVFMSPENVRRLAHERKPDAKPFPVYRYPESAAVALEMFDRYRERREAPAGSFPVFEVDRARAEGVIRAALAAGRTELSFLEAREVCLAYGIPFARSVLARSEDEAARVAAGIEGPVVMKVSAPGLSHKSDVGGVVTRLVGPDAVRAAHREMMRRIAKASPGTKIEGVIVQEMIEKGRETIIGVSHDPQFGPVLMFGLGGIYVEVLKDVAFRIVPVSDVLAGKLVRSIRAWPILAGTRGEQGVDVAVLEETILRVSQLVSELPMIRELDINPFMASPERGRSVAVDARMRIAETPR